MSASFFRSPSGDEFSGDNPVSASPGDVVPVWDNARKEWKPGTLPSSGSVVPLSNVYYVDGGTTVPAENEDGGIGSPFADVQQAIDAATDAGISLLTVWTTPGYTYGNITVPEGMQLAVLSLGGPNARNMTILQNAILDDTASLVIEGVQMNEVTLGAACVFSGFGVFQFAGVTGGSIVACYGASGHGEDQVALVGTVDTAQFTSNGCSHGGNITTSGAASITDGDFNAPVAISVGSDLRADLMTLAQLKNSGSTKTVGGALIVLDAPTVVIAGGLTPVDNFIVPGFLAPGTAHITISCPGARPGDTFAFAIDGVIPGIYPDQVAFGPMRCINDDQVDLIAICATNSPENTSCNITITRFSVHDP